MTSLVYTKEIYGNTLTDLGEVSKDVFVVEADLMKALGSETFKEKFPDRHINVGVAEQNLVGVAAGLAAMGRIPFASTFANFISQRAADQVVISVAYNNFNVKLIGSYAGLSSEKNGGTHISVMDIAIMRAIPNMTVIAPGDIHELSQALEAAYIYEGPVYIRMPKMLPKNIFGDSNKFIIGKGYQFQGGKNLTIVSTGISTHIAIRAQKELEKDGIYAGVLHLPTLKPADTELIVECSENTEALITVEDHSKYGGLGGLVSEIVTKINPVPVFSIGLDDVFGLTADLDFQLDYFGITVENICSKSKEIIGFK